MLFLYIFIYPMGWALLCVCFTLYMEIFYYKYTLYIYTVILQLFSSSCKTSCCFSIFSYPSIFTIFWLFCTSLLYFFFSAFCIPILFSLSMLYTVPIQVIQSTATASSLPFVFCLNHL